MLCGRRKCDRFAKWFASRKNRPEILVNMTSINVICTSVGNDGFSSILDALKVDANVFVTGIDFDPSAYGLSLADRGVVVPSRLDAEDLIEEILKHIRTQSYNILLRLSTADQNFYANHRSMLEKHGIIVAVASSQALNIANNKHELYRHCSGIGFPLPSHVFASNFSELEEAVRSYTDTGKRCVMKLAHGTGAQGVKIIDPKLDRSNDFWGRTKTTMGVTAVLSHFAKYKLSEPIMVSEFINGEHISVDAVRTGTGHFYGSVRVETKHLFGLAVNGETVKDDRSLLLAKILAESIPLSGAMNIEFRRDEDGQPKLLEINPSFGGSVANTIAAGLNLPLLYIRSVLFNESVIFNQAVSSVRFTRYWQYLFSK
jgi:carbamoyl-phosphate synthase large subunit